ncbi:single-stranded-DNA-specific exonuclease RecJ [Myroides injenensis]|uniref:single-stranded-DNA-specific exonuclease RecJ n=1 Tax=Myroides injenensis TaxID=1183151 RepID=UPI000289C350|nr:single-stranded-DNA-specific exonuclease RecJ [Myroides injenensis]
MRWKLKPEIDKSVVNKLKEELQVDEVIAKLLVQRGITTFEEARLFFRPSLDNLHDPFLMKDMDKAVERIERAIQDNERILIFGDYDVDGTTSVALLYSFIHKEYNNVETYIPDRYAEGYGISYQGIDYASNQDVKLIISIDCGIKSIEEIAYAKELGIDFVICDHHLPGEELPNASAILDPKREDCSYPFKELCGCGVGFKLIEAIAISRGEGIENLIPYLDLVVTAIVADVVPIIGENRVLAYYGLKVINENPRPGIKALLSFYKQDYYSISDIIFKVAPKINAVGRLEHGKYAVDLLTKFTYSEALESATAIITVNEERRTIDQAITEKALVQIIENKEINNKSTVVFDSSWHKGVIGIVASRLIETYYRPTIVFTDSGDCLAASARSVKNFDIYKALESCSEYLIQFGGHKYAAGMTIKKEHYESFKQKFEEVVSNTIEEKDLIPEIEIDSILDLSLIQGKFIRILKQFEPFGPGNERPVFLSQNVYDMGTGYTMGKNNEHLRLFVKQRGKEDISFVAVGFHFGRYHDYLLNRRFFDIVYTIEENFWKGRVSLQLLLKDMQLV